MNAATHARGFSVRALQIGVLGALLALLMVVARTGLDIDPASRVIAAIGILLLSGMLISDLVGVIGLPHLTGYIAAGVVVGPYASGLIGHQAVGGLQSVNTLALSLIALAGGLELRVEDLRQTWRSIAIAMTLQSVVVLVAGAALLYFIRPWISFAADLPTTTWLAVSLVWGVLAVSRSPSVTLAIISQLKPRGDVTRFALGFVMSSDVVVVVLMATVMAFVRPWLEPNLEISLESVAHAAREIVGSISIGTTLGLLLVAYLRLIGGQILLLLLVLSFVVSESLHYLRFEPMLAFLCAGFVVQNLSAQGDKLLHAIEETGSVVFVVFFATTGAQLNLPLLGSLWSVALVLCVGRVVATFAAHRLGSRIARDPASVRAWGWAPLVSQAGLTQGLGGVFAHQYPVFGEGIYALVIVSVALNAIVGPILFKLALSRAGEIPDAA